LQDIQGQKGGEMQRYPFLRFATAVLRILGWIVLVAGVIGSIGFGIWTGGLMGVLYAVGGVIFSANPGGGEYQKHGRAHRHGGGIERRLNIVILPVT
jgi:hypothetical protein